MAEQLAEHLPARGALTPAMPVVEPAADDFRNQGRFVKIASRVILAAAILCIGAAAALYAFGKTYDDRIYPGVYVGNVDVSGMSRDEAKEAIAAEAAAIENQRAYLDALDRHWAPTLGELGVHVNAEKALDEAFAVGREDTGRTRLGSMLEAVRDESQIPLTIELTNDELIAWADRVDEELSIHPVDAELAVVDGVVTISPESNGKVVDVAKLQGILLDSIRTLKGPTAELPIIDQLPSVYAADFTQAKVALDAALSGPITVTHENQKWEFSPAELGAFVGIEMNPDLSGQEAVTVVYDEQGLGSWLQDVLASSIDKDPVNAKVAWDGKKLKATVPGADGVRFLPQSLAKSLIESMTGDHRNITAPVQVLEPEVNGANLDSLGITTELARGTSNFDGSEESRATNIVVGTQVLNGTLVRPHGEFSFNHAIGDITSGLGFVDADVIAGERIGRDIGGGICQVSTTVFRAAILAGLEFTEWHPHRFRLGFYELDGWTPGLDAAIFQPEGDPFGGIDLRFANPSDSWLLVESYTDGPRAVVVIYGADLGYTVELSSPQMGEPIPATPPVEVVNEDLPSGTVKQTEWAGPGIEIIYQRTVYGEDGEIVRNDTFDSLFYPRSNVWSVSPDMQGQSPAA